MTTEHATGVSEITELPRALSETTLVLLEVQRERRRQEGKFGEQNLPWTERIGQAPWDWLQGIPTEEAIKHLVEMESKRGYLRYSEVLMEEVVEAFSATDIDKVREELIQVAAVAVAAIESIDRNGR